MSGLHKPGELGRWNQGDIARASSSYNDSFLLIYDLSEHGSEILAEAGIRRFSRHEFLDFIVQRSCTFLEQSVWTHYSTTGLLPHAASAMPTSDTALGLIRTNLARYLFRYLSDMATRY